MAETQNLGSPATITLGLRHRIPDHLNLEVSDPVLQALFFTGLSAGIVFGYQQSFLPNRVREIR